MDKKIVQLSILLGLSLINLPIFLFINYLVLFRTDSLNTYCEKHGIYGENTSGSLPFDLTSYTCGGVYSVFDRFEITLYYLTGGIFIICCLLYTYLLVKLLRSTLITVFNA